jgi:MFS family permease
MPPSSEKEQDLQESAAAKDTPEGEPLTLDLDESLKRIGLGWGQQMSMSAMSLMWIGENMQLFAMFYLPQALKDDWGTQAESLAWVDMALFVGVALGAFIGGECSDRFGRKPTVLWSALFATLIGFYNAYVNSIEELAIMRFLLGITLGSFAPASTSITLETCPQDLRGKFGMAIPGFSGVAGKVRCILFRRSR